MNKTLQMVKALFLSLILVLSFAALALADTAPAIDFSVLVTGLTTVITSLLTAVLPFVASLMGLSFGIKMFQRFTGAKK